MSFIYNKDSKTSDIGRNEVSRIKLFISSIPRFEAASISITSVKEDRVYTLAVCTFITGFERSLEWAVFSFLENLLLRQLTALAMILAVEVFPVPFCPTKKNACGKVFT